MSRACGFWFVDTRVHLQPEGQEFLFKGKQKGSVRVQAFLSLYLFAVPAAKQTSLCSQFTGRSEGKPHAGRCSCKSAKAGVLSRAANEKLLYLSWISLLVCAITEALIHNTQAGAKPAIVGTSPSRATAAGSSLPSPLESQGVLRWSLLLGSLLPRSHLWTSSWFT